jgi:hypothetical protein
MGVDKGRGNVGFAMSGVDVVVEGCEWGGAMRAKVFEVANKRSDGTSNGMAAASMRQDFEFGLSWILFTGNK